MPDYSSLHRRSDRATANNMGSKLIRRGEQNPDYDDALKNEVYRGRLEPPPITHPTHGQ